MSETNAPAGGGHDVPRSTFAECVEACFKCAEACNACVDACLSEPGVAELTYCIRTDLDCADLCETTGRVISRQTQPDPTLLKDVLATCARACARSGGECERHAGHHEHCRVCGEACRRCENACRNLLEAMA